MFTGLVETIGRVQRISPSGAGARIAVDVGPAADGTITGDSISINGVCLTVATLSGTVASFDAVRETLNRTTLGGLKPGNSVNIERALAVGDRLGGHFVQGHIDSVATLVDSMSRALDTILRFSADADSLRQIAPKGSIAINGVSLTVASVSDADFSVALIPETLKRTTLGALQRGEPANIELDIIGKYVRASLDAIFKGSAQTPTDALGPNADREYLRRLGWTT
ncbi:MAG: riboflavin synthase [Planctomycetota bacterium]